MFKQVLRASRWTRHPGTVIFVGGTLLIVSSPSLFKKVQNDVSRDFRPSILDREQAARAVISDKEPLQNLPAYVWGTNVSCFSPMSTVSSNAPRISSSAAFSGRALRDLVIHDTFSALVDAAGDVYKCDPFSSEPPMCILKGKVSLLCQ